MRDALPTPFLFRCPLCHSYLSDILGTTSIVLAYYILVAGLCSCNMPSICFGVATRANCSSPMIVITGQRVNLDILYLGLLPLENGSIGTTSALSSPDAPISN